MDTLHPLLGTDKANPLIELLVNPAVPDTLLVHFGMRLLETVHRGRDSVEEKLLCGRLYNGGFRRRTLVTVFGRDRHTIQRYGDALRSGDAERLRRALAGQGAEPKVEPIHEHFIRATFREQQERQGCHINRFICAELQTKLQLTVCYETVRLITVDERRRLAASTAGGAAPDSSCGKGETGERSGGGVQPEAVAARAAEAAAGGPEAPDPARSAAGEVPEPAPCPVRAEAVAAVGTVAAGDQAALPVPAFPLAPPSERTAADSDALPGPPPPFQGPDPVAVAAAAGGRPAGGENTCDQPPSASRPGAEKSKHSPSSPPVAPDDGEGLPLWFPHGGLLLVREPIEALCAPLDPALGGAVRHWLGTVLCGAVNLEQTKTLDHDAIAAATGGACPKGEANQRRHLQALATTDTVKRVRQANIAWLHLSGQNTFCYDPHGVEYTGEEKFLRGWLGCAHKVAKVYYLDFCHTLDGRVLAAFPADNYQDARQRLLPNARQIHALLGLDPDAYLTFVSDRAFYSLPDMLSWRDARIYLTTWEKGVREPPWAPPTPESVTRFQIVRRRNRHEDTITYGVEVYAEPWRREPSINRFVVRLTQPGPQPLTTTVGVLCTDPGCGAEAAVAPLLRRWLQENDILYLVRNFGINQITTYKTVSYAELAAQLPLEQMTETPPHYRQRCAEKLAVKQRWARELLRQETIRQRLAEQEPLMQARLRAIATELTSASDPQRQALSRERNRLQRSLSHKRRGAQRALRNSAAIAADCQERLAQLEREMAAIPEQASRLERLIEEQYCRLAFAPKALLDAIRIMAKNVFSTLHAQVRPARNNYRDDHVLVRDLLRAPAWLEHHDETLVVRLVLDGHRPDKDRAVIRQLLDQITRQSRLLDPNRRPVIFELAEPPIIPPPFLWPTPDEGT